MNSLVTPTLRQDNTALTTSTLDWLFCLSSAAYLVSLMFTPYSYQPLVKIVPMLVLIIMVYKRCQVNVKFWLLPALVASGTGDVLLALPIENSFIMGLGAFFVAHLMYIFLFIKYRQKALFSLLSLAIILTVISYGFFIFSLILPNTGDMKIAVIAYVMVISLMAISASISTLSWKVTLGAYSFVLSDSLIAINKFYQPISLSGYLVMFSYYLAQYFIIRGIIDKNNH